MWPSFNAAIAVTDEEQVQPVESPACPGFRLIHDSPGQVRAIVNTFLSISVSAFAAFVVSRAISPEIQFNVVHIQARGARQRCRAH